MSRKLTDLPVVVCLMGPTGIGKTAVALEIARRIEVDLISVDSAMVYRGMDIGTAKPTAAEQARWPHALIDIRDPAQTYSAHEFVTDADDRVRHALAGSRTPLLVGGTMLYFRAFHDGLADMPSADAGVRAAIEARARAVGWDGLHAELAVRDPQAARRIHPNNPQRLQRALEVLELTGRPISAFWGDQAEADVRRRLGVRPVGVALLPADRGDYHAVLEGRFGGMIEAGLVREVAALRARRDLHPGLPALRAVGYRQVWAHLDDLWGYDEMVERAVAATRGLARRQLTWLRSWSRPQANRPELLRLTAGRDPGELAGAILSSLELS